MSSAHRASLLISVCFGAALVLGALFAPAILPLNAEEDVVTDLPDLQWVETIGDGVAFPACGASSSLNGSCSGTTVRVRAQGSSNCTSLSDGSTYCARVYLHRRELPNGGWQHVVTEQRPNIWSSASLNYLDTGLKDDTRYEYRFTYGNTFANFHQRQFRTIRTNICNWPDLRGQQPDAIGTITEGTSLTFRGRVENIGTDRARGTFSNRFEIDLGRNGSSTFFRRGNDITGLNPGDTRLVTSNNTWNATPGNHRVRLCADQPGNNINESNENNNCGPWRNFSVTAALPDLVGLQPNSIGTVTVGTNMTFSGSVRNQGNANARGTFNNQFQIDLHRNGSNIILRSGSQITNLNVNQSKTTTYNSTPGTPGNHRVRICADRPGNNINESNENNNCGPWRNYTVNQIFPDLVTSNIQQRTGTLAEGSSAAFRGTVSNTGDTGTGGSFTNQFQYRWGTSGSWSTINTVSNSALGAGNSRTNNSASLSFNRGGTLQIRFCADLPANDIAESNESNNCSIQSFSVAVAPTASLQIRRLDSGDAWSNTTTVGPGIDVELRWSSTNATRCVGDTYFSTGNATNGTQQNVSEPTNGNRTYRVRCYNGSGSDAPMSSATAQVTVLGDNPEIEADPDLIDYGTTTTIRWDPKEHTGCIVRGSNGDQLGATPVEGAGSGTTSQLFGEVTYTISCDTGSEVSVSARVRPLIEEI